MNNKGITLIEIIISIVLISIVLIFLFSLLVTVNDINYESEVNSTYLINKSLIMKNIEEDFDKAEQIKMKPCENIKDLYPSYIENHNPELNKYKCLQFEYEWNASANVTDSTQKTGRLGIYYYKNKESYVISYIRGSIKATRTLPEYEKIPLNLNMAWKLNGSTLSSTLEVDLNDGTFKNIYIPIIGTDGKDYSLNISYYKKP